MKGQSSPKGGFLVTRAISSLYVTLIALGCVSTETGPDRISTNVGEIEVEASRYAYFASARVRSGDGVTDIRGRIESRTGGILNRPGHISLTIRDEDGELLHAEEVRYVLQRRPRRPLDRQPFALRLRWRFSPGVGCTWCIIGDLEGVLERCQDPLADRGFKLEIHPCPIWLESSRRAASRRSRASFSETSG